MNGECGGLTTVVNLTTAMGFRRRRTVVGFTRKVLVVCCELQIENYSGWRIVVCFSQRTTVIELQL